MKPDINRKKYVIRSATSGEPFSEMWAWSILERREDGFYYEVIAAGTHHDIYHRGCEEEAYEPYEGDINIDYKPFKSPKEFMLKQMAGEDIPYKFNLINDEELFILLL